MHPKYIALALTGIALLGYGIWQYETNPQPKQLVEIARTEPTTISRTGVFAMNNPGMTPNVPFLVYEEPGRPALSAQIYLDEFSVCATPTGALPCMAMSVTYDAAFGGKRVHVEGNEKDSGILARKLTVLETDEIPRTPAVGSVFISWTDARKLIENCEARGLMQTHALDVYIELPGGESVRAVEPTIDEMFRVWEGVQNKCPQIPIATE